MRGGSAKRLRLIGAMDGITIFPEEYRVRHGGIVPLFAVPDFVHRGGSIISRGSRISGHTSRYRPNVFFHPVYTDRHFLSGFVDVDEDGARALCFGRRAALRTRR